MLTQTVEKLYSGARNSNFLFEQRVQFKLFFFFLKKKAEITEDAVKSKKPGADHSGPVGLAG